MRAFRGALRKRCLGFTEVAAALAGLGALLGYLGGVHWSLDLLSHFRVQYSLTLLAATALFLLLGRRRVAALSLGGTLLGALPLVPYLVPSAPVCPASGEVVRVLSLNVLTSNPDRERVLDFLVGADADVIFLMEVDRGWVEALLPVLGPSHPHWILEPRSDNFGIALFSRLPLRDREVIRLDGEVPAARARMEGERGMTVLGVHPLPPAGARGSARRDGALEAVARLVEEAGDPVVVMGDLNATPWSRAFRRLRSATGLRDSAEGRGVRGTWMPGLRVAAIPIDHVLVSADLCVMERSVGPDVGSDHRPLVVTLVRAEPSP